MTTAVVILNWNGKALLEQFLPSVVRYSEEATVYVADNNSSDDSVAFVAQNFPTVQIIRNTVNGGYAKGYNDALVHVTEELLVLLNSDVEVTQNWLSPLITAFAQDSKLVAAQPKILDYNRKDTFEYAGAAGGFLDKLAYPYCRGRIFNTLEEDQGQYSEIAPIFWASGACLFVRNTAFRAVGGFDEDFFAHQEEIDLCWRLQSKGGNIKYIGSSSVYHVGGATLGAANPKKTFYNFRNTLLVLVKNRKGVGVWGLILLRLLLDAFAGVQFLIQGKPMHFLAILKAHFSFYSLVGAFLEKRKKWASNIPYATVNSIVWAYFVRGKKRAKNLQ
ncbi:MAG: glycosyltransferase family 2 protein [Marinirhabdus sp.]|nr:glycosyltransferase family 2 protein [Marinirhabdus sp.]